MRVFVPAFATLLLSLFAATSTADQDEERISLSIPGEVRVGVPFQVSWDGPTQVTDFIMLVDEGSDAMGIDSFVYVGVRDRVGLEAPGEPGTYDIIYVREQGREVLAREQLKVVDAALMLIVPESVVAGATVDISWRGDTAERDYVTIVRRGTRDGALGEFAYIRGQTATSLRAPAEPGEYELRYHQEGVTRSLARQPIMVTRPAVTLDTPDRVTAGENFTVRWQNAIRSSDYLVLVRADDPDRQLGDVTYIRQNTEASLTAPQEPGLYELRYMDESGDIIIQRVQFTVEAP